MNQSPKKKNHVYFKDQINTSKQQIKFNENINQKQLNVLMQNTMKIRDQNDSDVKIKKFKNMRSNTETPATIVDK